MGVSPYAINSRNGRRVTTNDAYPDRARYRSNLTISGGVRVNRVIVSGGRATGVEPLLDGEAMEIGGAEAILCAGAIPILISSGIRHRSSRSSF